MKLIQEFQDISKYLENTAIIDHENIQIKRTAANLSKGTNSEIELSKRVYEYVRDNIAHSLDINGEIVTCKASEALQSKEGICFAKAHLLAALLRVLDIPTGFCYQKLIFDEAKPRLILHGLNAVYLKDLEQWIRVDARGNKEGVSAEFSIEEEVLAFEVREKLGEIDYPIIYVKPNEKVVSVLKNSRTVKELINNLPSEL